MINPATLAPHDRQSVPAQPGPARIPKEQPIVRDFPVNPTLAPAPALATNRNGAVALVDLTLPQLAEAYTGLDRLEKEYENMSGICATLKGLVLIEAKSKPELKLRFKQWVIDSFPKSYKTATRYMRLAEAFGKSDSTGTFQTLTRDLASSVDALKQFQLDLSHPVVAKVADWVAGRGAYQLMLDFSGQLGGKRARKVDESYDPNSAAEEARDLWTPHLNFLESELDKPTWHNLPQDELARLKSILIDLPKAVKGKA